AEDASPTAQSPDYVPESDLEADPEEDDDEDPEEDHVDYPADVGDNGDDDKGSLEDDEDDDMDIEADDEEEEEEHPAPADSVVVALPVADKAPSAEETEPFETDESAATPLPHPAYRVIAGISILAPVPTSVWSDAKVARLLAISTPPSSPLSPWRSMDASDLARGEVMSLRTTVLGQMSEIRELHAADRKRHAVISEMLKADHRRSAEMR
ncbi:hypothetical protein Tco_0418437, partial [Tanacetum coccineum]